MTTKFREDGVYDLIGDHEERLRALERETCGPWIYVGTYPGGPHTTPDSPPFLNGYLNSGGGLQPLRFRWTQNGIPEIQGSVSGPPAVAVFNLPDDPRYRNELAANGGGELRLSASDDVGGFIVFRIISDTGGGLNAGDVVFGV